MNSDKFWLAFWAMAFSTVFLITLLLALSHYNSIQTMANQGYEEKIIVVRQGGDFVTPLYEKVWVKKETTPTLGLPSTPVEKK